MTQKILPVVNVKRLFVAKLTEEGAAIAYDKPRYLEGVRQLGIKPKQNSEPYYHEGRKVLSEQTLQDIAVSINITDLTDEDCAYILGQSLANEGGLIKDSNDVAPTVALLYEGEKANGGKIYGVLYAGTFEVEEMDYKAKEGKANFQSKKLQGSFRPLVNGYWNYVVADDSPNVQPEKLAKFFEQVTIPTKKTV